MQETYSFRNKWIRDTKYNFPLLLLSKGVGIAQSVERRATDSTAMVLFPKMQDFSLFHSVQAGCRAHPAFYPMGTEDSLLASKAAGEFS
jgi:hypothetical protein